MTKYFTFNKTIDQYCKAIKELYPNPPPRPKSNRPMGLTKAERNQAKLTQAQYQKQFKT